MSTDAGLVWLPTSSILILRHNLHGTFGDNNIIPEQHYKINVKYLKTLIYCSAYFVLKTNTE